MRAVQSDVKPTRSRRRKEADAANTAGRSRRSNGAENSLDFTLCATSASSRRRLRVSAQGRSGRRSVSKPWGNGPGRASTVEALSDQPPNELSPNALCRSESWRDRRIGRSCALARLPAKCAGQTVSSKPNYSAMKGKRPKTPQHNYGYA